LMLSIKNIRWINQCSGDNVGLFATGIVTPSRQAASSQRPFGWFCHA
jgi:hypothetical protein